MTPAPLAILGGSFDPLHIDHIRIGCYLHSQLQCATILYVPAYTVPLRAHGPFATPQQRLAMLRHSLAPYRSFKIEDIELQQSATSYLCDTIPAIRSSYRLATKVDVVVGDDLLAEIPQWKNIESLAPYITLIIMRREQQINIDIAPIRKLGIEVYRCTNSPSPISSTEIRRRIAHREPFRHLLPEPVYRYIIHHRLYGYGQ